MGNSFVKATKSQAKLRMTLDGPAGSGKTYSALNIAQHFGKVALIDTEHGSASKYADLFEFDTLVLDSFHPQKYIDAIKNAEQAGYDVLLIDSLSHAWNGKDGALELVNRAANKSASGNSYVAWGNVTPLQNQLVDTILAARLHIIATMRTKTEYSQEKDERGKTVIKKLGMAPVQRDGMEYEFDIVGELDADHNLTITKTRCLILDGVVVNKPGAELANTIRAWLSDGAPAPEPPAKVEPPAPHIPNLPAPVAIPSHGNGHTEPTSGVAVPPQLAVLIKQYAARSYGTPEKAKGARGVAVGILDEYAGDTDRRRSFLMAIFGKDSSSALTDGQVAAILAWKDAPNAKSEVGRVIADWLKAQGQQELSAESTPVTA